MFGELCEVFERIEATTKRLVINEILTEFFVKMMKDHPNELVPVIYLCLCRVSQTCWMNINLFDCGDLHV
jgi:DNA ligase-1